MKVWSSQSLGITVQLPMADLKRRQNQFSLQTRAGMVTPAAFLCCMSCSSECKTEDTTTGRRSRSVSIPGGGFLHTALGTLLIVKRQLNCSFLILKQKWCISIHVNQHTYWLRLPVLVYEHQLHVREVDQFYSWIIQYSGFFPH